MFSTVSLEEYNQEFFNAQRRFAIDKLELSLTKIDVKKYPKSYEAYKSLLDRYLGRGNSYIEKAQIQLDRGHSAVASYADSLEDLAEAIDMMHCLCKM